MRPALLFPLILIACDAVPVTDTPLVDPPGVIGGGDGPRGPFGGPPEMGVIAFSEGGAPERVWTTYDFSVGAYDASAWFGRPGGGPVTLTITGYPDQDPQAEDGLLRLVVELDRLPTGPGDLPEGWLTIVDDGNWDSPVQQSPARVTLDFISREQAESGYGQIRGIFTAGFCYETGNGLAECNGVEGRFATQVQFDSL
jgi:hypothetical protein